ncbi:MAG: paclitaxel/taxanoid biosynthesis susceptibility protein TS1 [Desulfobacterales bacterium]|nr:paclitaxel/taxanoid biosynthesis susceptibility protein TS1 [Desulfobacterales bacterium]
MLVFVLNKNGKPLMPCKPGRARRLLKSGKAKVVRREPFTIQLIHGSSGYRQPVTLGIDTGYENVGFSAVTDKAELISGEVSLLKGVLERLKERAMYRTQRRNRLRHRKPRFDNRKRPDGWLAPSIRHKADSHIRIADLIKRILPVTQVIVEVANFDIQKIRNPQIQGKEYQNGEQSGYWNLREYILHRDGHKCQSPDCKNRAKVPILELHHIGFWKKDRSDRPGNLITLCTKCHTPGNHKKGKFLYGWEAKVKSFRPETFMSTVRWKIVNTLDCQHTYGHLTKRKRHELELSKSHVNDAFVIAGGNSQTRTDTLFFRQRRKSSRCLEKFYDAKFTDIRTGKKASGSDLNCGRRTRNRNLNTQNLRKYRGQKLSKGKRVIRKQRYSIRPGDLLEYSGRTYKAKGVHCNGSRVMLESSPRSVSAGIKNIRVIFHKKTLQKEGSAVSSPA